MQPRCQREGRAISARRRARGGELAKRASFAGAAAEPVRSWLRRRAAGSRSQWLGTPAADGDGNQDFARFIFI